MAGTVARGDQYELRRCGAVKVLITGGAGFIGSHTADALIAQGHEVRILDLLDPQIHGDGTEFPVYLDPAVECVRGDVCDMETVTAALDGVDAVYHLAALTGVGQSMYDLRSYVDTNCTGTATLLEAIIKRDCPIQRLILASSRAVYGEGTHNCPAHGCIYPELRSREDLERGIFDCLCPTCRGVLLTVPTREERPLNPISVYAWTKLQQEQQCRYVADTFRIPAILLRYFNVYGSRQSLKNPYTGVMSIFYSRLHAGQPIYLYEHGKPGRDFVHVSDVVRANLLALHADVPFGCAINVGSGLDVTIRDVAGVLQAATRLQTEMLDWGEYRIGDIHSCTADLQRARQLLGYEPKASLVHGIREFTDWADTEQSVDLYDQAKGELQRHGLFGRAGGRQG